MIHQKIGIIGLGNMGSSILHAILQNNLVRKDQLFATNRGQGKLKKVEETYGIKVFNTNEELIDASDVVILAVKPQDLLSLLEPISNSFAPSDIIVSLAAGVPIDAISRVVTQTKRIVRLMPNTPLEVGKAVVGYCINYGAEAVEPLIQDLIEPMGLPVQVEEGESFEALTVACGSGTGFVFELMIYWQEWLEEHGFEPDVARAMTVQTFAGATALAENSSEIELEKLQSKVVSKKGVTAAGLESVRELEVDRALRYSFEKAVLRDRELGRGSKHT